ncbi:MAG: sulfatase-like hydrolase/transferase [Chitinophagaceae bacterium]|nr:sulfatase-like hydrolase/transferase [Chitinophagaceae bacterium]
MNTNSLRYTVILTFLLLIFLNASAQKKPNIVLILTDDMGYSDLGSYGNPVIKTPFLDSLGNEGFMSYNYVVSSPSCTPSRASLLTGRYASRYNLPDPIAPGSELGLSDGEITIAEMLKDNDYKTYMVGKWHLGDQDYYNKPNGQGFDSFYGMLYSQDYRHPYVNTDTIIKIFRNTAPEIYNPHDSILTQTYTQEAIKIINKQSSENPFFLYIAHNMPHLPVYYAAQSTAFKNAAGGPLGAVVSEIDASTESIVNALREKGLLENTIIIFSSDNGPWTLYPARMEKDGVTRRSHAGSTGVFRGAKVLSYEGGARVPFIAYWRGKIDKGIKSSSAISNVDILPTIAKWTGSKLPTDRQLDGEDISKLLEGSIADKNFTHRPIFIVNHGKPEAVKIDKWKYREAPEWRNPATRELVPAIKELFDLDEDPSERVNLIDIYPEKAAELKKVFQSFNAYN